jgi:hypothetical protein
MLCCVMSRRYCLESKSLLEGLPKSGGAEEAGSAAYVRRAAKEAHNILNGMLA